MTRLLSLFGAIYLVSCGGIAVNSERGQAGDGDEVAGDGDGDDGGDGDEHVTPPEPVPDCSGEFGEPETLFEDAGWINQGLAPASNGLEFFYARLAVDTTLDDSGTRLPTLRTRQRMDEPFGEPQTLTNLATACENERPGTELGAIDLSVDGKRLYIGCSTFIWAADSTGPLLMFERADFGAPFEGPPRVVGEVGISLGITKDELTAYGTSLDPAIGVVVWYHRSSVDEPFGPPEIVPGQLPMSNPEPSPDGLALWGVKTIPDRTGKQLTIAAWNAQTGAYDAPISVPPGPPVGATDSSPALASDCRTIYFARYTSSPSAHSQVMFATRAPLN